MGTALPDFPDLMESDDSMLSRKFGKEVFNYFGWSNLNRVSFLRTDHAFLDAAFCHQHASILPIKDLSPLMGAEADKLQFCRPEDVVSLTGPHPFKRTEQEMIDNYDSEEHHPTLIFLGIKESATSDFQYKTYRGEPFFALDVTPRGSYSAAANVVIANLTTNGSYFNQSIRNTTLNKAAAGIYSQARAITDWNSRNQFCGGCGKSTLVVNAGYKRVCPPTDRQGTANSQQRPGCATRGVISNLSFPRTDSVMIAAIVSVDGKRILLGRQKSWPPYWYSTLAGFIEPGESVEEAVRREVWEESGVKVGRVVLHSSQPWPFPSNLMLGAIGQAQPGGEAIDLGNDPELESAKWFSTDEVREALAHSTGGLGQPPPPGYKEGGLRLPPPTAIANKLLAAVIDGFVAGNLESPRI